MNILFITSSRIGDAVLSTGLLDYMAQTWPMARVTIACGPLAVSLFGGYPNLERIIPLRKQKHNRHWIDLWKQVAGTKWDMVVDLRNSAISRLIYAKKRFIFGGHIDQKKHKVEQNAGVMKLAFVPAPKLWFTEEQMAAAEKLLPAGGPILGVGPAANWQGKTWPWERFLEIVKYITAPGGMMPGARVAVFGAPGEEAVARRVLYSLPPAQQLNAIAQGDPGTAAAAIARCDFYIGNDSGLMHCAAACGVPTLGLFGPSWPHLYRPWGGDYIATPENFDELINYPGYTPGTAPCLMESLTVDMVKAKLDAMLTLRKTN
jgi:ADP-heptose:LPS heptosyltransferase